MVKIVHAKRVKLESPQAMDIERNEITGRQASGKPEREKEDDACTVDRRPETISAAVRSSPQLLAWICVRF